MKPEKKWDEIVDSVNFKYLPIVNIYSGITYGFEMQLSNYDEFGYEDEKALFEDAYSDKMMQKVEVAIRERGVLHFLKKIGFGGVKLFLNAEVKSLQSKHYRNGGLDNILNKLKKRNISLCFQLKQKIEKLDMKEYLEFATFIKEMNFKVAIDNYGSGCFNYRMLYENRPDFLKIDSFFTDGIKIDSVKKIFVSSLGNSAKVLGVDVIVKGVNDKESYYVCKELGISLIQGSIVQEPTSDFDKLLQNYKYIEELHATDRRKNGDLFSIQEQMESISPIYIKDEMADVLEKFRTNKNTTFLPLLNEHNEPIGIVREQDLKDYVYSSYGTALLRNKSAIKNAEHFLTTISTADIHMTIEKILEIYSQGDNGAGVIITQDSKYIGFLTSKALLKALNDKNLSYARDQNPLSKLPGNKKIDEFIELSIEKLGVTSSIYMAYLDFDNFKPFNDKYGFRNGDRAILLFADIVKKLEQKEYFVGHIGGDDFFIGSNKDEEFIIFYEIVRYVIEKFQEDAESFYSKEDRASGCVIMSDRDGNKRSFPLLGISAAIMNISHSKSESVLSNMDDIFSILKKSAKKSPNKTSCASLL